MARRRRDKKKDETLVDITEARESAVDWIERNQHIVLSVILGLVFIVAGWFIYQNMYKIPRDISAQEQMFRAQFQFERDSFALALENPGGGYPGFLGIIDQYRGTTAANLSRYYAGISYLNLGRYDDAIEQLRSFSPNEDVSAIMKHGALGDAYAEKGDFDNAIRSYRRAVRAGDNAFLTPYFMQKYGLALIQEGRSSDAISVFEDLKREYPNSQESQEADRFIARARAAG